jgi:hypothetical protein
MGRKVVERKIEKLGLLLQSLLLLFRKMIGFAHEGILRKA